MNSDDLSRQYTPADRERIARETFVQSIECHRQLSSTNDRAIELAADPQLRLPGLVLTELQLAGRGRGANRWWSAPGALTFSVIISRSLIAPASQPTQVSLTAGLAVCEALHRLRPGLEIGLKWPNDVYVQSRKVCGILVEVPPGPLDRIVVGIGINVNNSFRHAPESLQATGTSLIDVTGYSFDLAIVLISVLHQLSVDLGALAREDSALIRQWQSVCMLTGRQVRVDTGPRQTCGICQGIDPEGALVVETSQGRERCVSGIVTILE